MEVASIRYKNPGAMWGGARANKWGALRAVTLNDGKGQGNNIAEFPTYEQGAAAQFDLWQTSYCNMSLDAATMKWSGGNSSPAYIKFLTEKTGLQAHTLITKDLLNSDTGWRLMKAQAQWEAGKPYPMTDAQWKAAQKLCFGTSFKQGVTKTVIAAGTVTSTVVAAQVAHSSGYDWTKIIFAVVAVAIMGVITYLVIRSRRED